MTKEEKKKQHLNKLNAERVRRYYERHPQGRFDVKIEPEILDKINTELKKRNITKKQFVLDSFEKLMKGE